MGGKQLVIVVVWDGRLGGNGATNCSDDHFDAAFYVPEAY